MEVVKYVFSRIILKSFQEHALNINFLLTESEVCTRNIKLKSCCIHRAKARPVNASRLIEV